MIVTEVLATALAVPSRALTEVSTMATPFQNLGAWLDSRPESDLPERIERDGEPSAMLDLSTLPAYLTCDQVRALIGVDVDLDGLCSYERDMSTHTVLIEALWPTCDVWAYDVRVTLPSGLTRVIMCPVDPSYSMMGA